MLGVVLWQTRRAPEAADAFRAALARRPAYADAHYMLGTVLRQIGKVDEALTEFQAHYQLALALTRFGGRGGSAGSRTWMKRGGWRLRWCQRMQSSAAVLASIAALAILVQAGLNAGATGVPLTSTRGGAQAAHTGGKQRRSSGPGPGAAAAAVPFSFRSAGRDAGLDGDDGVRRARDRTAICSRRPVRRGDVRLRRRRAAGSVLRQRHHARRLSQGRGAAAAPVSQPGGGAFEDVTEPPASATSGAGARAPAPATTTTTATTICSSPTTATTVCSTTPAAARFDDVTERGRARRPRRAGAPAARSSTTTATAGSTCSSPTTSTSTSPRRRRPTPACAATRGCRWRAVRLGCKGGKNVLYHNRGDGTFDDVSEASGITRAERHLRPRRRARSTSTTTAGPTSTSPTTRTRARCTATVTTGRSRTSASRRLRVQPGRQAAGRHGRRHRRLRSQRLDGHPEDELRRRHVDALRQHRATASARTRRSTAASGSTRAGSAGARASPTSTTTAGSTSSSTNGHVYPEVRQAAHRGRLRAAQGRLPQHRQRPVRRRTSGSAPATTRRPGGGPRSGTSTTTARSTSPSTTCTTRRTCS